MTDTAKQPANGHASAYGVVMRSRAKAAMRSLVDVQLEHENVHHQYFIPLYDFVARWLSPGATSQGTTELVQDVAEHCQLREFRVSGTRFKWCLAEGGIVLWSEI